MEKENTELKFGGYWSPTNCQARHKVIKTNFIFVFLRFADK